MEITFHYTMDDVLLAHASHRLPVEALRRRRIVLIFAAALAIFLVFSPFLNLRDASPPAPGSPARIAKHWSASIIACCIIIPLPLVIYMNRLATRQNIRRTVQASSWFHQPHTLRVTDTSVILATPEGHTEWKWPTFRRLIEAPAVVLLYTETLTYLVVPKRIFSPDQLNTFTQLCRQNIHEPLPGAFPVLPPSK